MKVEEAKIETPIYDKDLGIIDEIVINNCEEKEQLHKTTTIRTTFTMVKLFIGISILASPHAFENSGVLGGIIGFTFACILSILTVNMQSDASMKIGKDIKSYSELGYACYGAIGKLVVDSFMLFTQLGICIAYLIFNGTQIDQILCLESQGEICNHKNIYIMIAVIILSPVCWIKHIKNLSWIAFISLASILLALGTILYYDIKYITEIKSLDGIKMFDILNYPFFFGIALLNFEGNPATLNVQASMKHPNRFKSMYMFCAIFVSILVIHVASLSYIAYGSEIKDLAVFRCKCFRDSTSSRTSTGINNLPNLKAIPATKFILTRTLVVAFCGIVAISIPKFGLFLDFIGAFTGTALCFVLPVLFYNKAFSESISRNRKLCNLVIMTIGILFGGVSTIASFLSLIMALFV